jgi:hypothetical protein
MSEEVKKGKDREGRGEGIEWEEGKGSGKVGEEKGKSNKIKRGEMEGRRGRVGRRK